MKFAGSCAWAMNRASMISGETIWQFTGTARTSLRDKMQKLEEGERQSQGDALRGSWTSMPVPRAAMPIWTAIIMKKATSNGYSLAWAI